MSGFALGLKSIERLRGVHPNLVRVVYRAIEISTVDFTVTEGVRTKEKQAELYAHGRTAPGPIVTWTMNSKHVLQEDGFGHAVDVPPYPISWESTPENLARFDAVAAAMLEAAKQLNVKIRWGGNWDGDDRPHEKGESDGPHFELA